MEEAVEVQLVKGAEDGGDMAVRAGADDVEGAFQDSAERIEFGGGPIGEIGEGAVPDFAVDPKGFAEEDGGRAIRCY